MDDIVAVEVLDEAGTRHHFLLWGRVYGATAYDELIDAVARRLAKHGIRGGGTPRVLPNVQPARDAPHFFEIWTRMLLDRMDWAPPTSVPPGRAWLDHVRAGMDEGRMVYYLGAPPPGSTP